MTLPHKRAARARGGTAWSREGWAVLVTIAVGCGGTTTGERTMGVTEVSASTDDAHTDPALAALRPSGSAELFARLEANPRDASAYADAAVFFANGPVPGMAVVYGQMSLLLEPRSPRHTALAATLRQVFERRIDMHGPRGLTVDFAPDEMPTLVRGDDLATPFAYRFEQTVSALVVDSRTFDGVAFVLWGYPAAAERGGALGSETELAAYLRPLADHALLGTYAHWVIGPACGAEWTDYALMNDPTLQDLVTWVEAHPFSPTVAPRPDDVTHRRRE